jgi:hypothetical protein
VQEEGPSTPNAISASLCSVMAASFASSTRATCTVSSDGGSSGSRSNDAGLLPGSSKKQQQCGGSRGGFMRRVAGCVVQPLRELLLHATG